jgi:uncharacterized protein YfeS
MKASSFRPLLSFFIIIILACQSQKDDPVASAKAFYEALAKKDFKTAKQFATKDSKTMLELIESMSQMAADVKTEQDDWEKMKNAVYSNADIEGDRATVTVKIGGEENLVKLKKEDGTWKVALDKETLQETIEEKSGGSTEDIDRALDSVSKELENAGDSIGKAMEETGEKLKKAGEALQQENNDR